MGVRHSLLERGGNSEIAIL